MKRKTNAALEQALDELRDALRRWKAGELDDEPTVTAPELPEETDPFLSDDPDAVFAFSVNRRSERTSMPTTRKRRRRTR